MSGEDIAANTAGLSKTKTRQIFNAQINVRTKVLKTPIDASDKVPLSKAPVDDLKAYLVKLIEAGSSEETGDLLEIIVTPSSIVGMSFSQKWEDDGAVKYVDGDIVDFVEASMEYKVKFSDDADFVHLTVHEVITDITLGDLDLH